MIKKLTAVLAIALSLALISGCAGAADGPSHTSHQNPASAKDALSPVSLLSSYANVMTMTSLGQYQEAEDLLKELEDTEVPEELDLIIKRLKELSGQLLADLDNLEKLLGESVTLLAASRLDEVEQVLKEAALLADKTGRNLDEIELVIEDIDESLFAIAGDFGFTQSQQSLAGAKDKLDGILESFTVYQQALASSNQQALAELAATQISITVHSADVFAGDDILISGKLISGGEGLAGRTVKLLIGEELYTVFTAADGSFAVTITVPCEYESEMTLEARYDPAGFDDGVYAASYQILTLEPFFYSSQFEVTAPPEIQPGYAFSVAGGITSDGGITSRILTVYLDGVLLFEGTVSNGDFEFELMPPVDLAFGSHNLSFSVAAFGRYADVSKTINVEASKLVPEVEIKSSSLVFLPGSIAINGNVYSDNVPLSGAEVKLVYGDEEFTSITSVNGRFAFVVELDFGLMIFGLRQVAITVEPLELWYAPFESEVSVAVINPAYIGLMAVAFISGGVLYRRRSKPNQSLNSKRFSVIKGARPAPVSFSARQSPEYAISGVSGRVLAAYLKAMGAVEKTTGIIMTPDVTLREYLAKVEPSLSAAKEPFIELNTMAEAIMYSTYRPDINEAFKAELLATAVRKGLGSA